MSEKNDSTGPEGRDMEKEYRNSLFQILKALKMPGCPDLVKDLAPAVEELMKEREGGWIPEKGEGMKRSTVRWSEDIFVDWSTQGRVFAIGERIEITKGLPVGSRLVGVRFEKPFGPLEPGQIVTVFESHLGVDGEEIIVELKTDRVYEPPAVERHPPIRDIRIALGGFGNDFVEAEESEALKIVYQWLDEIEKE